MNLLSQPFEYWRAGGPLLVPIAVVCFAIWAYFFKTRRLLSEALSGPDDLEKSLSKEVHRSNLGQNIRDFSSKPSRLAEGIAVALGALRAGGQAGQAFDDWQANEIRTLKRDVVILAALTTVAPLLGLLGTVIGMVSTFDAVADTTGDTAIHVASGISQALITTQFGLIVAIPGVFGLACLHRMLDHVRVAFARCRSHLMLALEQSISDQTPIKT